MRSTARQQQLQHHWPAMGLQLQYILAGKRMRCREVQGQTVVYGAALGVKKGQVVRVARIQTMPEPCFDQRAQILAAKAHDAHRGAAGRCGDSQNWVVVAGEHGSGLFEDAPIIRAPGAVVHALCLKTSKAAYAALLDRGR